MLNVNACRSGNLSEEKALERRGEATQGGKKICRRAAGGGGLSRAEGRQRLVKKTENGRRCALGRCQVWQIDRSPNPCDHVRFPAAALCIVVADLASTT